MSLSRDFQNRPRRRNRKCPAKCMHSEVLRTVFLFKRQQLLGTLEKAAAVTQWNFSSALVFSV